MATRKKALMIIIDTSQSMGQIHQARQQREGSSGGGGGGDDDDAGAAAAPQYTKLDTAKECAALFMAGRSIDESGKKTKCETGIIAYGTEETDHDLMRSLQEEEEMDEGDDDDALTHYKHMKEVAPLEMIKGKNIAKVYHLETSVYEGDVLSCK